MRTAIVAAAVLVFSFGAANAQFNEPGGAILTVQGQGRVQVPPDHANMSVEVLTRAKTPEAASAAHRERAARAADALRNMANDGLSIERSAFRLDRVQLPPQPNAPQGRVETEYQAVTTFELKSSQVGKVDGIVTAIASTGLFEVHNMSFGIEEKNAGMSAARKNAVDDARRRAETYADAAGVQIGEVLRIDDTDTRSPREFAVAAPVMRSVQVVPPETLTLSATVRMTWRINAKP